MKPFKNLIPDWLRRAQPAATEDSTDSRTPLEIARAVLPTAEQRYEAARADAEAADQLVARARARLRDERSDEANEALLTAKAAAEQVKEWLDIAREDAESARAAVAQAEHAELIARRDRLASLLAFDAVLTAGAALAREEAQALVAVAKVRAKRLELRGQLTAAAQELVSVQVALGEHRASPADSGFKDQHVHLAASPEAVLAWLAKELERHTPDSALRRLIVAAAPTAENYSTENTRFASVDAAFRGETPIAVAAE